MTNIPSEVSPKSKRAEPIERTDHLKPEPTRSKKYGSNARRSPNSASEPIGDSKAKHERLLTLLRQPNGTTIEDMMTATGWQQHSVRGFLAGTVKKKLGLSLTSIKSEGEARHYRIATRRGR